MSPRTPSCQAASRVRRGLWAMCLLSTVPAALIGSAVAGPATPAATGQAQPAADPEVVITRRVQPRVAYRGVPLEANPVASRAAVFPRQVFDGAIDGIVGVLAGDDELDTRPASALQPQHVSNTVGAAGASANALLSGLQVGSGAAPLGGSARAGGAVSGATAGLGSTITGALAPVVRAGNGP